MMWNRIYQAVKYLFLFVSIRIAKTWSMTKNRSHDDDDDDASSSKTCAPWSDLNHDVLDIVMMILGFGDYYSFRLVCKPWRLLADSNNNRFMASMPPMPMTISTDADEKACCCLEDSEGRKFKTILPDFSVGGECVGLTCGYLIFFTKETRDFWLVNPIARKQLHFPHFPNDYNLGSRNRAILVFSPSISGWVFVVLFGGRIWFCVEDKRAWKHVPYTFCIYDVYAFKGKIYTLTYGTHNLVSNQHGFLCELGLKPEPKFTLLEIRNPEYFFPIGFVSSGDENLFVIGRDQDHQDSLREVDIGEMRWVKPCEATLMEKYSFFYSKSDHVIVAVKQESQSNGRIASFPDTILIYGNIRSYSAEMWYFPHSSMSDRTSLV